MCSLKIIFVIVLLVSGSAFAGEFDSEQFWQAPQGKLAVVAEMGSSYFVDDSIIINGTLPAENKVTGQIYRPGILAEYGLMKTRIGDYSIALASYFRSQVENNGINEPSGVEDAMIALRGRWLVGKFNYSVHYGVRSFLSFGDRVIDQSGDVNSVSGGLALEPYLGFQYLFRRFTLGIETKYKIRYERGLRIEDNILLTSENAAFENGDQISGTLFAELPFDRYLLGFRTSYFYQQKETLIRASGSESTNDDFSTLTVGIYGSWDVKDSLVLVPRLEQKFLLENNLNGREIDNFSQTTLILELRFTI